MTCLELARIQKEGIKYSSTSINKDVNIRQAFYISTPESYGRFKWAEAAAIKYALKMKEE